MNCPQCNDDLIWVDQGPKLQYHYCRTCKKELADLVQLESPDAADTREDVQKFHDQLNEELEEALRQLGTDWGGMIDDGSS